jgi:hypothetical protein
MYLWTAPGTDETAARQASGVTDNAGNARHAAEALLRTGQAGSAYIERAYTAMASRTLSLCYVRTGTGWSGRLSKAGQVVWTPFSVPGPPGQSPSQRFPRPARSARGRPSS